MAEALLAAAAGAGDAHALHEDVARVRVGVEEAVLEHARRRRAHDVAHERGAVDAPARDRLLVGETRARAALHYL